jgi:hypothetical protein
LQGYNKLNPTFWLVERVLKVKKIKAAAKEKTLIGYFFSKEITVE